MGGRGTTSDIMTEAQLALLRMLARAYNEDLAVALDTRTRWDHVKPTASRIVGSRLVERGYARLSKPYGHYLLITVPGRVVVAPAEAT